MGQSSTLTVLVISGIFHGLLLTFFVNSSPFHGPLFAVLIDSDPFHGLLFTVWSPDASSTIDEPRGAFTGRS